ncbi:hypothetical protein MG293_020413 [Ovis ammon polii]|uniref:Secreted protein n=1 Tax=Ovis ammon polii TaxID=230172 RepID=A0AAD4XXJ0_OVIAM|nr:hypothetical protein MG293_020413 [Ovis ammon polii]
MILVSSCTKRLAPTVLFNFCSLSGWLVCLLEVGHDSGQGEAACLSCSHSPPVNHHGDGSATQDLHGFQEGPQLWSIKSEALCFCAWVPPIVKAHLCVLLRTWLHCAVKFSAITLHIHLRFIISIDCGSSPFPLGMCAVRQASSLIVSIVSGHASLY